MPYSLIELQTRDLDLFFRDPEKHIHIASGGGLIPGILADNDLMNEAFIFQLENIEETFEIEVNPNLGSLLEITDDYLQNYLDDFERMARRGFYSYDKTKLGHFNDHFFHLVAWPKNKKFDMEDNGVFDGLLRIVTNLPISFDPFDLFSLVM